MVVINEDDYDHIAHYGTPRHSGRYPWGSGGNDPNSSEHGPRHPDDPSGHHPSNPIPNNAHFLDYVENMKRQGLSEVDIAKGVGLSVAQLRAKKSIARSEEKLAQIAEAQRLKYDKSMSNTAAAAQMGIPESTFRTLLDPSAKERALAYRNTADMLKSAVDKHKFIDVGTGVPNYLNISDEKLRASIAILEVEGYQVHPVNLRTVAGFDTKMKVLVPPGVDRKEAWSNRHNIKQLNQVTADGGESYSTILPPLSINPRRVAIRYGDEGGKQQDGMIHVREGVPDLSLGGKRYAQVRVLVGDTHYMKGMAIYKEGLPDGVDIVFNTNKARTGNKKDALKPLEPDPDFPFGSVIKRQIQDNPGTANAKVTSAMNIVNEQGDWINWNRNISAQALSKQDPRVIKNQLDLTFEQRKTEFDSIMALTNPTVRKKLLESFADSTDAASVHLKAAGFERQNWHVILPIESLKPHEVYAPNYRDGEEVVLIRYPHGGTFEIPHLVVNNKNREARKAIGTKDVMDAIGIHHEVAEKLSGADFDGDTVLVIPNEDRKIKATASLERLKGFDPKERYRLPEGQKFQGNKQHLMGDVSNLITDMTIKGAPHSEIVRAVMHSMVVIDAEKHDLNYKQSAMDFNIKELKVKYQGGPRAGAATLISRAKSEERVPDRKLRLQGQGGPIDPVTGAKVFVPTQATITTKSGAKAPKMIKSRKLAETEDATTLLSGPFPIGDPRNVGTPRERLYAGHSNKLKTLANSARLSWLSTPTPKKVASAAKVYATEVSSLDAKLNAAIKRRPLERQAQVIASQAISAKRQANPSMTAEQLKKVKFQEQRIARSRMGLTQTDIKITDKEWAAIQAGAISNHKLEQILAKADMQIVREHATPKNQQVMTTTMTTRVREMLAAGYTQAEAAQTVGVSVATLNRALTPSKDEEEED